jgi:bla regulator protein blaR1
LIEARIASPTALPAGLGFLGDASLLSRRADVLAETLGERIVRIRKVPTLATLIVVSMACAALWLPLNPHASRRSNWSPWPEWSARVLNATGIEVRDYEVDGHRLASNEQKTR